MLKTVTNIINASQITGVLPVVNGGTGVTTSTGTGNTVLSAAPTLSGNVNLSTGNLVIGTAGKGIDFSADPSAAGMTSELFDDYEEGTWTPNQGAGLVVTGAFSSTGTYTKIGRQVTVIGSVSGATSISVSAIGVICSNLPFTVTTQNTVGSALANWTGVTNCLAAATSTDLYSGGSLSTTNSIIFTVTYFV
jgi:hypothetical protein